MTELELERVEKALYKRAVGYYYKESDSTEDGSKTRSKFAKKYEPPNVQAIMFILKSQFPDKWAAKVEDIYTPSPEFEALLSRFIDDEEDSKYE